MNQMMAIRNAFANPEAASRQAMYIHSARDNALARARRPLSPEEQALTEMDPIDAYKLSQELENKRVVSPEQATANQKQNARDLLSIIPGPANVIAAEDAVTGAGNALSAVREGAYGRAALEGGMALLSGVGAVTGLPTGRIAGEAARGAKDSVNMFAGPLAKTADHAALAKAQEMAKSGAGRDAIHAETGWFQGTDGGWRFEIDDSKAFYRGSKAANSSYADEVYLHPELYDAYPSLRTVKIKEGGDLADNGTGSWSASNREIVAHGGDKGSVAAHEMQHAGQDIEGFSTGSNPSDPRLKQVHDSFRSIADESDAVLKMRVRMEMLGEDAFTAAEAVGKGAGLKPEKLHRMHIEYPGDEMKQRWEHHVGQARLHHPDEQYYRTAGEVEARNVQNRLRMTAAERRAKAPWLTQDVPDDLQIVRRKK